MPFVPKDPPLLFRRKYAPGDGVSLEDLRKAHYIAARIAKAFPKFLPVFIRLDQELQAQESQKSILERAVQVAEAGYKPRVPGGALSDARRDGGERHDCR